MEGVDWAKVVQENIQNGNLMVYGSWAVFGLIAGFLAKLILPGRDPGGLVVTALIGVAGAFIGNYLYGYCTGEMLAVTSELRLSSLFFAVVGGICLLIAYRVLFGGFRSL